MTKYTECMKVMCELYKWNMLQVWGGPGLYCYSIPPKLGEQVVAEFHDCIYGVYECNV